MLKTGCAGRWMPPGGCEWESFIDPEGVLRLRANGGLVRWAGWPEGGVALPTADLRGFVHPDDMESFNAHMALHREVLAGKTVPIPSHLHRVRGLDGAYRWIRMVTDVDSNRRGPGGSLFGFALDVHDQQEAIRGLADVIAGGQVGT
ncbi:hypothetical protein ACTTAI_06900 [Rhodobacter capsulatus]|uniref:hypothetical protein n=1 Tax=Rhodobacter capsulatus TaxID=1061 RepID=UPI004024BD94